MNNENPNNTNSFPAVPELGSIPATPSTVDPTGFQTVDPTAGDAPAVVAPVAPAVEAPTTDAPSTDAAPIAPTVNPVEDTSQLEVLDTPKVEEKKPTVVMDSTEMPKTRYNPVTGEEVNLDELTGKAAATPEINKTEEAPKEEKKETEYKPTSKGNTIVLIIFFIALIAFVVFLPNIQTLIQQYKDGPAVVEEIYTGKLVCTLESNTVNLDRNITRTFVYNDKKLESAKFVTEVRGDPSLDEEALNELNDQCTIIKDNVDGLKGISVDCSYSEGKLIETESFDYADFDIEEVDAAYTEAGGNVLDFKYEEDIDEVMTQMRRSGFSCSKEK